jgi:hypothetical protein
MASLSANFDSRSFTLDSKSATFFCAACTSSMCRIFSLRASAMIFSVSWLVFSRAAIFASLHHTKIIIVVVARGLDSLGDAGGVDRRLPERALLQVPLLPLGAVALQPHDLLVFLAELSLQLGRRFVAGTVRGVPTRLAVVSVGQLRPLQLPLQLQAQLTLGLLAPVARQLQRRQRPLQLGHSLHVHLLLAALENKSR